MKHIKEVDIIHIEYKTKVIGKICVKYFKGTIKDTINNKNKIRYNISINCTLKRSIKVKKDKKL